MRILTSFDISTARRGRVVVISPHFDDAVLSLGATIRGATRRGVVVEILTVFPGDPESREPPSAWDRRTGYANAAAAASGRRAEDSAACAVIGARPTSLPDASRAEEDAAAIRRGIDEACSSADLALIPGFPLVHDQHRLLARLLAGGLPCPFALYVEQPYAYNRRRSIPEPVLDDELIRQLATPVDWIRVKAPWADVLVKRRAIGRYRTQLSAIGLGVAKGFRLERFLWHEYRLGGEMLGFVRE